MGNYLASREYLELESKRELLTQQYKELSEQVNVVKNIIVRINCDIENVQDYEIEKNMWESISHYEGILYGLEQQLNDIQSELTLNNAMLKRLQKHKENTEVSNIISNIVDSYHNIELQTQTNDYDKATIVSEIKNICYQDTKLKKILFS
jgi:hypothetical protein